MGKRRWCRSLVDFDGGGGGLANGRIALRPAGWRPDFAAVISQNAVWGSFRVADHTSNIQPTHFQGAGYLRPQLLCSHQGRLISGSEPVPNWVHGLIDEWTKAAGIESGKLFRRVSSAGRAWGEAVTETLVWRVVKEFAAKIGVTKLAPHDLRRSCARLAPPAVNWSRFNSFLATCMQALIIIVEEQWKTPCSHVTMRGRRGRNVSAVARYDSSP